MSNVTGIIQNITVRMTSAGEMADITVAGQRYGAGKASFLKAKEGDYVTFEVVENGNFKNVGRNTLKVSKHKPPADAVAEAKASVGKAANSFDARQDAISRQAASNTAIAWVGFLHTAGAIDIPATKAKSKGGTMAYLDVLRREYEKEFFEGNTGNKWTNIAPEATEDTEAEPDEEEAAPEDSAWE